MFRYAGQVPFVISPADFAKTSSFPFESLSRNAFGLNLNSYFGGCMDSRKSTILGISAVVLNENYVQTSGSECALGYERLNSSAFSFLSPTNKKFCTGSIGNLRKA